MRAKPLLHSGGMPARGTELETYRICQGNGNDRSLYWLDGQFYLFARYYSPPVVMCDNQPAITTVRNGGGYSRRAKHIAVRGIFVKEFLDQRIFDVKYVPSKENLADIFTKPLPEPEHRRLRESLVSEQVILDDWPKPSNCQIFRLYIFSSGLGPFSCSSFC